MKTENTNYKKVTEIDGEELYADKDGYFLIIHYPVEYGWRTIPVRLGKTAKQVEQRFIIDREWCYRAGNGEMKDILKAMEEIRKLPDIQ